MVDIFKILLILSTLSSQMLLGGRGRKVRQLLTLSEIVCFNLPLEVPGLLPSTNKLLLMTNYALRNGSPREGYHEISLKLDPTTHELTVFSSSVPRLWILRKMDRFVFPVVSDEDFEKFNIINGDQIIIIIPWSHSLNFDKDVIMKKIRNCRLDNVDLAEILINEFGSAAGNICILIAKVVLVDDAQITYTRLRIPVDPDTGSVSTNSFDFESQSRYDSFDTFLTSRDQFSEMKDHETSLSGAASRSETETWPSFDNDLLPASRLTGATGSDFYNGYKSSSSEESYSRRRHCLLM